MIVEIGGMWLFIYGIGMFILGRVVGMFRSRIKRSTPKSLTHIALLEKADEANRVNRDIMYGHILKRIDGIASLGNKRFWFNPYLDDHNININGIPNANYITRKELNKVVERIRMENPGMKIKRCFDTSNIKVTL